MEAECLSPASTDAASEATRTNSTASKRQKGQVLMESRMTDDDTIPGAQPPSEEVLMSEVRYAIVFAEMNELANLRLHKLCVWAVTLFTILTTGGLGAVVLKMAGRSGFDEPLLAATLVLGLVAAAAEATRRTYKFDEQAKAFRKAKDAFQDLEGRGWGMNLGNLQREIIKLRKGAPSSGGWLADPAYNKACQELGYPDWHRPVRPSVSFFSTALAS